MIVLITFIISLVQWEVAEAKQKNTKAAQGTSITLSGLAYGKDFVYGWSDKLGLADDIYVSKKGKDGKPVGDWKKIYSTDDNKDAGIFRGAIHTVEVLNDNLYIIVLVVVGNETQIQILFSKIKRDGSVGNLRKASYVPEFNIDLTTTSIEGLSLYGRLYLFDGVKFYLTTIAEDGDLQPWTLLEPRDNQKVEDNMGGGLLGGLLVIREPALQPISEVVPIGTVINKPVKLIFANGYFYAFAGIHHNNEVVYSKIKSDGTVGSWQSTFSLPADFSVKNALPSGNKIFLKGMDNRVLMGQIEDDGNIYEWKSSSLSAMQVAHEKIPAAEAIGVEKAMPSAVNVLKDDSLIANVLIDAYNPNVIYAYDMKFQRLIKSFDKGQTWKKVMLENIDIFTIKQIPGTKDTFLVLTKNNILKTFDGGNHWKEIAAAGLPGINISGIAPWGVSGIEEVPYRSQRIAISKSNPKIVYLALTDSVYKSTDGGERWIKRSNGIQATNEGIKAIHIDKINPDIAYIELNTIVCWEGGQARTGIFSTNDGGLSWKLTECGEEARNPDTDTGQIAVDPSDSTKLLIVTDGKIKWIDSNVSSIIGRWEGMVKQPGYEEYPVVMIFKDGVIGTIKYPTVNCSGSFRLVKQDNETYTFAENIERGECVNNGLIEIKLNTNGLLDWKWYCMDDCKLGATATLKKNN